LGLRPRPLCALTALHRLLTVFLRGLLLRRRENGGKGEGRRRERGNERERGGKVKVNGEGMERRQMEGFGPHPIPQTIGFHIFSIVL